MAIETPGAGSDRRTPRTRAAGRPSRSPVGDGRRRGRAPAPDRPSRDRRGVSDARRGDDDRRTVRRRRRPDLGRGLRVCSASRWPSASRTIRRPAVLYARDRRRDLRSSGSSRSRATGFGNVFDLGAEIRQAVEQSDLLRPPVDFQPGWHAIIGWIMGAVGFAAAWLARRGADVPRSASSSRSRSSASARSASPSRSSSRRGLVALVLFVARARASCPASQDATGRVARRSRSSSAERCGAAARRARHRRCCTSRPSSNFLFPPPIYDPAQEAKKPKTIPLSEVEDRVLFTVEAKFTGPWKMGSLDVYDARTDRGACRRSRDSELNEVPESGIVERRSHAGRACDVHRPRTRRRDPSRTLPNTVGIVAIGPTLSYDGRTGNIRIVARRRSSRASSTSSPRRRSRRSQQLNRAGTDYPDEHQALPRDPDPPPASQACCARRRRTSSTTGSTSCGSASSDRRGVRRRTPVERAARRACDDMLAGSKEGTPFEIVAAQAMLARWAGIPSRIGYGFDEGDPARAARSRCVRSTARSSSRCTSTSFGWLPVHRRPAAGEGDRCRRAAAVQPERPGRRRTSPSSCSSRS